MKALQNNRNIPNQTHKPPTPANEYEVSFKVKKNDKKQ
jgi:hypothetical protein